MKNIKYLVLLTSIFITPQYLSCSEMMLSAGKTVLSALSVTPSECLGSLACGVCIVGCVGHCCCNESPEQKAERLNRERLNRERIERERRNAAIRKKATEIGTTVFTAWLTGKVTGGKQS